MPGNGLLSKHPGLELETCFAKAAQSIASHQGVGISHRDDAPCEAAARHELRAGRLPPRVRAGLQGDVKGCAAKLAPIRNALDGHPLGVPAAIDLRGAAGKQPALLHDDTPHRGIGVAAPDGQHGLLQGLLHPMLITASRGGQHRLRTLLE